MLPPAVSVALAAAGVATPWAGPDDVTRAESCLAANAWICGEYLQTRQSEILAAVTEHVALTVASVLVSIPIAFALALLARRSGALHAFVVGTSTALYTIPSLALFALLLPVTGITRLTVLIGLVLYSMTVLVRAFVDGLTAVPAEVVDAARGMGYGPARLLWRVRLPLALPTMFAGLRVATVSTVALVTIGFVVGYGGLGNLISDGLGTLFRAEVLTATVLCVVLAVVADLVVVAVERLATPWRRGRRA